MWNSWRVIKKNPVRWDTDPKWDDPSETFKISEGERRLHEETKVGESMDKPDLDRWKSEKDSLRRGTSWVKTWELGRIESCFLTWLLDHLNSWLLILPSMALPTLTWYPVLSLLGLTLSYNVYVSFGWQLYPKYYPHPTFPALSSLSQHPTVEGCSWKCCPTLRFGIQRRARLAPKSSGKTSRGKWLKWHLMVEEGPWSPSRVV